MLTTTLDVTSALKVLTGELREEIPQTVERGLARMRQETPSFFVRDSDPDFAELNRQSYVQQLRFIYDGIEGRRELEGQDPPPSAVAEARMAASLGIKLATLETSCRIGHRLLFDEAIDKAHETIPDPDVRAAALRTTSSWLFGYFDWLSAHLTDAYERERDLLVRDRERRKRQLVRDLLDGEPVDAGQLGYPLDRTHLAIVAWGEEPELGMLAFGEAMGLGLLSVSGTSTTAWGWLGGAEIGARERRAVRDVRPPPGTFLALGEPGHGVEGFRLTHRQAWSTHRIVRAAPAPVTWHTDVALLALTLQDAELAREFVLRELGPLADEDERSTLLRETLAAYFAAGQNAASAAAALGVHNRTVLYRIRSIEKRLGHPIAARREELAVAVRLSPVVLRAAAPIAQAGQPDLRNR